MDAFAKNIRALIKREDTTQQRFAESIDVSLTTVNGWLKRDVQPKSFNVDVICEKYGLTHDDLMSEQNGLYAQLNNLTQVFSGAMAPQPASAKMVPIRNLGAAHAGDPDEPWEFDGETMLYAELAEKHKRCFSLRVNGTCMNKYFTDRDVIFVDPDIPPSDGSIGVVMINGETVVRKVHKGNTSLMLTAETTDVDLYEDIVITGDMDDVRPIGTVFWWQAREI